MNNESIESLLSILNILLMAGCVSASILTRRAIPNSHVRYIARSYWLAIAIIGCLACTLYLGVALAEKSWPSVAERVFYQSVWVAYTLWALSDDNWFNRQFKHLKKGLKSLRERAKTASPSWVPTPTPQPRP